MSIALSSIPVFAAAVAQAQSIDFAAYTLRPGVVRDALLTAARGGAHIRVRLERDPRDDAAGQLHAANSEAIALLKAAGADAAPSAAGAPVLHLKAAVVDGVAWLDDRNWAGEGHESVLRDSDLADVNALCAALDGAGSTGGNFPTTKGAAQASEVNLIQNAGAAPLAVESESFGNGAVYNALLARARAGLPSRLLVAGREERTRGSGSEIERRRLAKLESLGVEVRTGNPRSADAAEKLAVAGPAAWVGSANATYAGGTEGEQRDWGLATRAPQLVDGLRAAFEQNWLGSIPFVSGAAAAGAGS